MPRWEFHLSAEDTRTAARWAWMYRHDGGDTITSSTTFGSYSECVGDALQHGYGARDSVRYSEPPLVESR